MNALLALYFACVVVTDDLPVVRVVADNTVITESCRLMFEPGRVIEDTDFNGVIHIEADGIVVQLAEGSGALRGTTSNTPWDQMKGIGIRINGHRSVTIRGIECHGFKLGIWATNADDLTIENCDVSNGYAQRLGSTPQQEDSSDWLFPHENDQRQWVRNFGAGIVVEQSRDITISNSFARKRQNGIILDAVNHSRVFDNDFSFLSGWGLAMWRSSDNMISRNAFDFCIRGYSHDVYNRGQDSAGILMFEQCNNNAILENSVTHGGDGFFGFGGKASLNHAERTGNNATILAGNDFSYAAAHGIEQTFSFENLIIGNRLESNAICGVWGGYSQNMTIMGNLIISNGQKGYGLERGGINIEHGAENVIKANRFRNNACGVHLWDDDDAGLLEKPWAKANHKGSVDNVISDNEFDGDAVGIQLRETRTTRMDRNQFQAVAVHVSGEDLDESDGVLDNEARADVVQKPLPDLPEAIGNARPIGKRANLAGRENIIMGAWFPWDHVEPMARLGFVEGGKHTWDLFNIALDDVVVQGEDVVVTSQPATDAQSPGKVTIDGSKPGVHPYTITIKANKKMQVLSEIITTTSWEVTVFAWDDIDPRVDVKAWRELAEHGVSRSNLAEINFKFAGGGPADVGLITPDDAADSISSDHFGLIARTEILLSPGRWRVVTKSDDGVRVSVNGQAVIDNWTWHGPTRDQGEFEVHDSEPVLIKVEYFEINGYATLSLALEPVSTP